MNATLSAVDTKTRILDAAERIFGEDGFEAASLRTITTAAQVNLGAVNYHFQTKEALFCAVIERRATPINKRRVELLDAISGKPTPEAILDAFLRPVMGRASTELSLFRPLMARLHSLPVELHKRILEENFSATFNRFVDALSEALPQASRDDLKLGLFFIIGALAHSVAWEPVVSAFLGRGSGPEHFDGFMTRLMQFGAAGMRASSADPAKKTTTKRVNH